MNIVLAGMPGSGKTTVSEVLAELLKLRAVDTDAEIVSRYGAISDIFDKYGEECFRNLETEVIKSLSEEGGLVVSTGGGALLRAENRDIFKKSGKIVYLKAEVNTLLVRVGDGEGRPLLFGDAENKLRALYEKRAPVYEAAADFTVATDGVSPEDIAKQIAEILK